MRFLLDESAEIRLATFLVALGHDVTAIARDHPASLPDLEVLRIARAESRILITNDPDFGELIFRQNLAHAGVIYFRLPLDSTANDKMMWLGRILADYTDDLREFIVVQRRSIRVRKRPES